MNTFQSYKTILKVMFFLLSSSCNGGHASSSVLTKLIKSSSCAIHVGSNFDSNLWLKHKTVVSPEKEGILENLHHSYISHSVTHPTNWTTSGRSRPQLLHSLHYNIVGCVSFLLVIEQSLTLYYWDVILQAIQNSGYVLEPSTLFWVILPQEESRNSISTSFLTWLNRDQLLVTDVTLIFLLTDEEERNNTVNLGIFCYFCKQDKIHLLQGNSSTISIQTIVSLRYKLHNNLHMSPASVNNEWWVTQKDAGPNCTPFEREHGLSQFNFFTCFPHGRIILNLLREAHNFTPIFPPESEVSFNLFYNAPYFTTKHPIVLIPGPFSYSYPRNLSKTVYFNTSSERLFYCIGKYAANSAASFDLLMQPFTSELWITLAVSTVLLIIVLKPKDPLAVLGIIVGQGYAPKLHPGYGSGNSRTVRVGVLVMWSLLISTSISFLYNGLLTADMLVPLPDKVIGTFKELILSGFKIGYMSTNSLSSGMEWYKVNFIRNDIMDRWNTSFVSTNFDDSIHESVVVNKGSLAIFRDDTDTEGALLKIHNQIWRLNKTKQVRCHMVGEPLIVEPGVVRHTSIFFFHMSTAFARSLGRILESGILSELTKYSIWQKSKLPRKPWEADQNVFKPSGLNAESKIPVIFFAFMVWIGMSIIWLCLEMMGTLLIRGRKDFYKGRKRVQ